MDMDYEDGLDREYKKNIDRDNKDDLDYKDRDIMGRGLRYKDGNVYMEITGMGLVRLYG